MDRRQERDRIARGETILPGSWFTKNKDSLIKDSKTKENNSDSNSDKKNSAENKPNKTGDGSSENKALSAVKTNKVISDTKNKVMSAEEFLKSLRDSEAKQQVAPAVANAPARANTPARADVNNYALNLREFAEERPPIDIARPMTQAERMAEERKQQRIFRLAGAMKTELDEAAKSSDVTSTPSFDVINQSSGPGVVSKAKAVAAEAMAKKEADSGEIIKAGSIFFGVTLNMVSSEQPGTPVVANVVTGPYRGAKLLGSFDTANKKLIIRFNTMVMENRKNSFPIGDAYAIDTKDGQTAVQTGVNNHYLLRYGSLLAASFLQGLGEAVTPSQLSYINLGNDPVTGLPIYAGNNQNNLINKLSPGQVIALRGLGQMGTTVSGNLKQIYNTPPTVVVDKGTLIGVLFMQDVTIPVKEGSIADDPDYLDNNNQGQLGFLRYNA